MPHAVCVCVCVHLFIRSCACGLYVIAWLLSLQFNAQIAKRTALLAKICAEQDAKKAAEAQAAAEADQGNPGTCRHLTREEFKCLLTLTKRIVRCSFFALGDVDMEMEVKDDSKMANRYIPFDLLSVNMDVNQCS